ncbi:MAG TPA: dienelactone hydrolase family protein [Candidatus Binatia bacterium]|jgi:carboxymethylenebutenolidase|nr:dienelactone hydrolase family protein [Candidatus Binatia bacterium]
MTSEITWTRNGDVLRGHVATPAGPGPHLGLVLIPDVRGVSAHFRDVAARFAAEGFFTLAIDLYSREGVPDLPDMAAVGRWLAALPDRRILDDLASAVAVVAARPEVSGRSVGITGFCMGGQYALMAACTAPGLSACVSWYGMLRYAETAPHRPVQPIDLASRLACPFLGFFGDQDGIIPTADVEALRAVVAGTGQVAEIVRYADAGHAFFNDARPETYRPAAAADAWPRAVGFLRHHLG